MSLATWYKKFYSGDTIKVTGKHLLCYGLHGRVDKWLHGDFYWVTLENGHCAVLENDEIDHIVYLPEDIGE